LGSEAFLERPEAEGSPDPVQTLKDSGEKGEASFVSPERRKCPSSAMKRPHQVNAVNARL
jgi:hypothetical protein